ncbi:MAG: hypothetical protein IAE77_22040 [Prosthecobacter sp.]|uniref:hypothetical protein n=1 Tax=Prosthecobacter sp. TaxID=1965333 RepID=UPI001A0AD06E|nr:hypothetical protein [Prosthecobacter sp.]MBE2286153.1 hypothetical protein [Prosthecobacter sp.]
MRRLPLIILILALALVAQAESRVFVSLAGTLLEAEITAVKGEDVTLKRLNDEQPLVVNRKTLCKEDNAYIQSWQEQNGGEKPMAAVPSPAAPPQKFSITCQTLPSKRSRGSDLGMRVIELSYNFNLNNREVSRDLTDARGVVVTLGRDSSLPGSDLIILQKEAFEVNIRAQSKIVQSTTPVRLSYSVGAASAFGVKGVGYVLIIHDAAGNILFTEASPDTYGKFTKEIMAITEVPCIVDRDFKLKPNASVPTGYISF